MIKFQDFKALDIRIGKILSCEDHPNADKLYVVTADIGGGETRKLVAGIREHYSRESLLNREFVCLCNLEPAIIRGVESQGMLLATKDESGLAILVPEKEVKVGSPVS